MKIVLRKPLHHVSQHSLHIGASLFPNVQVVLCKMFYGIDDLLADFSVLLSLININQGAEGRRNISIAKGVENTYRCQGNVF